MCQFLQLCSSDLSDMLPSWALRVYPCEEGVCGMEVCWEALLVNLTSEECQITSEQKFQAVYKVPPGTFVLLDEEKREDLFANLKVGQMVYQIG